MEPITKSELICESCSEKVINLYECDFCRGKFCFTCYSAAAQELNGGLNVRNTGWNCCYSCAEKPQVQNVILREAKDLAEGDLVLAWRDYRKKSNELAAVIDDINQKLKKNKAEK